MPCYSVRTTQLSVEAANLDVLARALESLGLHVTSKNTETRTLTLTQGRWRDGKLTLWAGAAANVDANAVRRAYSRETIISTAQKAGWQLRFQQDGRIQAVRRTFS